MVFNTAHIRDIIVTTYILLLLMQRMGRKSSLPFSQLFQEQIQGFTILPDLPNIAQSTHYLDFSNDTNQQR